MPSKFNDVKWKLVGLISEDRVRWCDSEQDSKKRLKISNEELKELVLATKGTEFKEEEEGREALILKPTKEGKTWYIKLCIEEDKTGEWVVKISIH